MRKETKIFLFGIVLIIVAGMIFFIFKNRASSDDIIIFYSDSCPHCAIVEEYLVGNQVAEKINYKNLEASRNQTNARLLAQKALICGISANEIGVPLLWNGASKTCISGDQPIIEFFKNKIGQ